MSDRINSIKLNPEQVKARQDAADARSRMTASEMAVEIMAERKAHHNRLAEQDFERFVAVMGRVFNPSRWFRK